MKTIASQTSHKRIRTITIVLALLVLPLLLESAVSAQSAYPPAPHLAAQWWQWALETPTSVNPLTDETGQFAAVNQPRGHVWFLAGNQGGTTVRTVTIPAGKALFFPVANTFDVENGTATGVGTGGKVFFAKNPLQTAQALVADIIATASDLFCQVDGRDVAITSANLEQSNPFALQLPTDNILQVQRGVYSPAVDSGYYVLIPPLSRGQHMIRFSGSIAFFNFSLDVTYNITIQ